MINFILTCIKYPINRFVLRPLFKTDPWHDYPYNHKQYAVDMVKFINHDKHILDWDSIVSKDQYIVEVGCGRGDIIGRINRVCKGKFGYDIDRQILKIGKMCHRNVKIKKGTFSEVKAEEISIFIMVNFIQSIPPAELKGALMELMQRSNIKLVVLDTLKLQEGSPYQYAHDGAYLLPGFEMVHHSKKYQTKFNADRRIEYWMRK